MIKSFFCSLFIAIFFLQPVLAMECKMDDWHKRRIYDAYFPNQHKIDQNDITKYVERFNFLEDLIMLVRTGDYDSVCKQCENSKIEAKYFNEFKFDEAENSFLHFLVSDWISEFSPLDLDYSWRYNILQKNLKDKNYFEAVRDCIKYLKEKYELNLEKTNKEGLTVMHIAAARNRLVFIKVFFDLDKNLLELKHGRGKTPLLFAAHEGKIESIKLLLSYGANIMATDIRGWNIFHVLIKEEKIDYCKELICYVKNKKVLLRLLTAKDSFGKSLLDYVDKCSRNDIQRLLQHF